MHNRKRYIGVTSTRARTMLPNAMAMWPDMITADFWSFTFLQDTRIHNDTPRHGESKCRFTLFTGHRLWSHCPRHRYRSLDFFSMKRPIQSSWNLLGKYVPDAPARLMPPQRLPTRDDAIMANGTWLGPGMCAHVFYEGNCIKFPYHNASRTPIAKLAPGASKVSSIFCSD